MFLAVLLLTIFTNSKLQAQAPTVVNNFIKTVYINGHDSLPYRLLYPANYNPHKKYPLILFLHGAGERGSDNEKQLAVMPKVLTDSLGRKKYACFILAPQCTRNDVWVKFPNFPKILQATDAPTPSARKTFELLDSLMSQLPLDKRRIYITGYSMGGEGTFDFLIRRPGLFAAAAPVCSVSDTSKAKLISKIPIWAFHGDQDDVNDVKYSRMMITCLKKHGSSAKYTEYPGVKHNSWRNAYTEPELFKWMFAQKLHD